MVIKFYNYRNKRRCGLRKNKKRPVGPETNEANLIMKQKINQSSHHEVTCGWKVLIKGSCVMSVQPFPVFW